MFSHNLHGADEQQLRAIRRQHFSDALCTAEATHHLPRLLKAYREQYTVAFKERRNV